MVTCPVVGAVINNITLNDQRNLDEKYKVNPDEFLSKGKATPFEGEKVFGRCMLTMVNGKIVYKFE